MYTIGYVGNKKLTHEELERIVENMQSTNSNIHPQNKRRQFIPIVPLHNFNNPAIDIVFNEYPNDVEVIGNIHDNPEFLEGEG